MDCQKEDNVTLKQIFALGIINNKTNAISLSLLFLNVFIKGTQTVINNNQNAPERNFNALFPSPFPIEVI